MVAAFQGCKVGRTGKSPPQTSFRSEKPGNTAHLRLVALIRFLSTAKKRVAGSVSLRLSHALAALMCLHAARLPARVDASGNLSSLFDQDRSRWDQDLVTEGQRLLDLSATGTELTEYHVEAAIASFHSMAQIVLLYDKLMTIRPSPVVALNRAIAVAQLEGPERGLEEIHAIAERDRLASYPFYSAALGELELRSGRHEIAREHFRAAVALARNPMERRSLEQRVAACEGWAPQHIAQWNQARGAPFRGMEAHEAVRTR